MASDLTTKEKEMERSEEPSNPVLTAKRRRRINGSSSIYLPDDIMSEIFLRLPARSLVRLRLVCKSWRRLSSTPLFIESHAGRARTSLVFQHLYDSHTQFDLYKIDHMMEASTPPRIVIPNPTRILGGECGPCTCQHNVCLLGSCDDLLLFQERYDSNIFSYHVLNGATKEWLPAIPELRGEEFLQKIAAFYFHRSTGEYRLLSLYIEGKQFGVEVFGLGRGNRLSRRQIFESELSSPSFVPNVVRYHFEDMDVDVPRAAPQVVVCGRVHWPPYCGSWLLTFDVESEKFREILLPPPLQSGEYECSLIDIGGSSLGLYRITSTLIELWLLKENAACNKEEEWVKEHTILTDDFIRRPYVRATCTPLALWNNDDHDVEILIKWDNGVIFVYNLNSKICRDVTPVPIDESFGCACDRRSSELGFGCQFSVALLKETLRDHKI